VDDHGLDAGGFEENDVARDRMANRSFRRIHKTAAILNDKGRPLVSLQVRQRFKQHGGFGN